MSKQKLVQYNICHRTESGGYHEAVEGRPMGPFLAIRNGEKKGYILDHTPSGCYVGQFEKINTAKLAAQALISDDPEGIALASLASGLQSLPPSIADACKYLIYLRECELAGSPILTYTDYKGLTAYE